MLYVDLCLLLLAAVSCVRGAAVAPSCGIQMNGVDIPPKSPLYLEKDPTDGTKWILPVPVGPSLDFNSDILFACSGKNNPITVTGDIIDPAKCSSGTVVQVSNTKYNVPDLQCTKTIVGDINPTAEVCGNGLGEWSQIGFDLTETDLGFVPLFRVCYDSYDATAVYSEHTLPGSAIKNSQKVSARPAFKSTGTAPQVSPAKSYTQAAQLQQFATLLGASEAPKYINSKSFLSRGHLAPDADFIFGTWQFSTYFYVNTLPEWQVVNAGNWLKVESMTRDVADRRQESLTVYTGKHDILQLPNSKGQFVDIYLEDGGLEVPKFIWKVLYSNSTGESIALVSLNNPFITTVTSDVIICKDICATTGWAVDTFKNTAKGYTYCCDVNELSKVVGTLPALPVTRVMKFT